MIKKIVPVLFFIFSLPVVYAQSPQDMVPLRSAIQVASTVSEGSLSMEEAAVAAKKQKIDVIIFTERDLMRWEYGLWPLRNIIKKRVENPSLLKYGAKRYLLDLEKLKTRYPGLIFIAGVESAPFYRWEGSVFKGGLVMHDWHRHLLAVGMDKPGDYLNLPVIGNRRFLSTGFKLTALWPFLLLVAGIFLIRARQYNYRDYSGKQLAPYSLLGRIAGLGLIILSFLFIANNFLFYGVKFDAYHGDKSYGAYQDFIDYTAAKGGLVYWSHPEAEYILNLGGVDFKTLKHPEALSRTRGYTGFCIFYEGYEQIGRPGGLWDKLLLDYAAGKREKPLWAIAGLSFETGDFNQALRQMQTVILAKDKNEKGILEALRRGKNYVVLGENSMDFSLDKFSVSSDNGDEAVFSGEAKIEGKVYLNITGNFLKGRDLDIKIIKDGVIVETLKVSAPFNAVYIGDEPAGKEYYRLEITGKGVHAVTNPIFVRRK